MRFLLKPSSSIVANRSRANQILVSTSKEVAAPPAPVTSAEENTNSTSSGKAWGQQCSPNCGCVLRIEAQLSECPSKTSPTIVSASYHARRVMATTVHKTTGSNDDDVTITHLKPLTTQQRTSRPILTSCTCPTLHHLAQQTVDHLPGKTLAQMRNEVDMGMVGVRSSVAFRHTVLRENVLPAIAATSSKQLGMARSGSIQQLGRDASNVDDDGNNEMNSTHRYGQCYDLFEDSLLSLIYERMPNPRKDNDAESYSPTLGRYFGVYSHSRRNQPTNDSIDDIQQDEDDAVDVDDWQRETPSSFFLFGDTSNGHMNNNSLNMTGMFFQHLRDSIINLFLGDGTKRPEPMMKEASEEHDRPTTTYLQLLDMYGADNSSKDVEEPARDDWLRYVDQIRFQGNQSTAG